MFDGQPNPQKEKSVPDFVEESLGIAGGLQQLNTEGLRALSELCFDWWRAGNYVSMVMVEVMLAASGQEPRR